MIIYKKNEDNIQTVNNINNHFFVVFNTTLMPLQLKIQNNKSGWNASIYNVSIHFQAFGVSFKNKNIGLTISINRPNYYKPKIKN